MSYADNSAEFLLFHSGTNWSTKRSVVNSYLLTTSLAPAQAGTARVVAAYRQLANIEARFRVLEDFLHLRPIRHWAEQRVRGHVAVCVYAAVIETLITCDLAKADVRDP